MSPMTVDFANSSNGSSRFKLRSYNWIKYLTTIALALVIIACANVRTPTGGPDDKTAPVVLQYSPANFSTQFGSRQIIVEFDEWIQLNDINNQLIVSPPMDPAPIVTLKKKSIIVQLSDDLLENTTYSLSFGEGVEDYRASNAASGLRYVFSTGDALDSLHFDGKVVDAFSGKPMEDVKVMLYNELADSIVTLEKPLYFGITDEEGKFDIDYLKSGNFKCFALFDENANYLLDDGESHGWTEVITPVVPDSSMDMTIRIHSPESKIQLLSDYESDSTGFVKMDFAFRSPSISVSPIDPTNSGQFSWPESQDSAYFWMTQGTPANNLELKISDGELVLDTIEIDWFSALPTRALSIKSNVKGKIQRDEGLNFSGSRILTQLDPSKLSFEADSTPVPFTIEIDESFTQVDLKTQLNDDQKYKLLMLPGAITSREGWTNDTLDIAFGTQAADYYGNLDFSVSGLPDGKHILQFLNARDEVIYEFTTSQDTSFSISRVPPETFTLRSIQDLNDNDKWDSGDYWTDQQPERVLHYAAKIQVRSNWDQLIEWRIISP
jgi:hypothetical protein